MPPDLIEMDVQLTLRWRQNRTDRYGNRLAEPGKRILQILKKAGSETIGFTCVDLCLVPKVHRPKLKGGLPATTERRVITSRA
jgi:hypothetical protein